MKTDLSTKKSRDPLTPDLISNETKTLSSQVSNQKIPRNSEYIHKALHKANGKNDEKSLSGKILSESVISSKNAFVSGFKGIGSMFLGGYTSKNTRNTLFGILGSIFGIFSIRDIIELPKRFSQPQNNKNKVPLLFTGAKLIATSSIAISLLKSISTGTIGLNPLGLFVGLGTIIGLNILTNIFEKDNSISAKIANILGLRESTKTLMDSCRFTMFS
jgi:hypothetical protein